MKILFADMLSFVNAFFGFASITATFHYQYAAAAAFMLAAVVADFFDGKVARYMKQSSDFGKNIDSLSDLVSFGVAPAFLLYSLAQGMLAYITFLLVLGGIYRLARYNVMKTDGEKYNCYYIGMPITLNGLIIPAVYFAFVPDDIIIIAASVVLFALMVSHIRIRKLF